MVCSVHAVLFAKLVTTGDIERQGIPKRIYEYVASHELFQIEQFTLVNFERDAAAQAEGAVKSSCQCTRGSEYEQGEDQLTKACSSG